MIPSDASVFSSPDYASLAGSSTTRRPPSSGPPLICPNAHMSLKWYWESAAFAGRCSGIVVRQGLFCRLQPLLLSLVFTASFEDRGRRLTNREVIR